MDTSNIGSKVEQAIVDADPTADSLLNKAAASKYSMGYLIGWSVFSALIGLAFGVFIL